MGAMRRFGSDRERRRRRANALYEFEMLLREEGLSHLVYDQEKDLFRFVDGRFAFSREYANEQRLREIVSSGRLERGSSYRSLGL